MGKFLLGVFVGAMIIGPLAKSTIGGGIGHFWLAKYDCEKSGKECVMLWDFVEVEADYE
jgi:hypothetical protein